MDNKKVKALIVEDDFVSRQMLLKTLQPLGECDIAVDGKEACVGFSQAYENSDPYNLICLDVMIPHIDGLEVLKRLREYEKNLGIGGLDGTKVIMISSLQDQTTVNAAFLEGCEVYLVKPFQRTEFLRKLNQLGLW